MIYYLVDAEREIEAARQYLNLQSADLGDRFLQDVNHVLEAINANPLMFPPLETFPGAHPYRRALLRTFRYALIFELIDEDVLVIAFVHTSRRPNYWLSRRPTFG